MAAFRSAGSDEAHLVQRKMSRLGRFFRWTCPHPEQLWEVQAGVWATTGTPAR